VSRDQVSLRPGRASDLEAITVFTTGTFEWGDYVSDMYLEWLEGRDNRVVVAVDADDRAIAVMLARMLSPTEAWLSGVRVHPDHRRQGLASQLNENGMQWAKDSGALVARLATEEDNQPARRQVEKLGYRPVARFSFNTLKIDTHPDEANGWKRPPGPERFDVAPSAEAEPAFMVWSTQDLATGSHGLYPAERWTFRRLRAGDLAEAGRQRQLWVSPAGWAIAFDDDGELFVSLPVTTPEDADRFMHGLVDLAHAQGSSRLVLMPVAVPWLQDAVMEAGLGSSHPTVVYERAL
jgi:ribosomal protein S18 acetylase RimI-like enzyme